MKPSSTTGTKNMDNNYLSAADICRIIKQCHASGIAEVSLPGGVSFKFHPRRNEDAVMPGQASDHNNTSVVSEFQVGRDQAELMDQEALLEAEEAQMLIDDPFAFEKSQIDRHIEKARAFNEKT